MFGSWSIAQISAMAFVTWGGWLPIFDKFVLSDSARKSGGGFHALTP